MDVSTARPTKANASSTACYQGQTHGNDGILLSIDDAQKLMATDKGLTPYLHPYMITDDLIGTKHGLPSRYVIDFEDLGLLDVRKFPAAYKIIEQRVLQDRIDAAAKEQKQNSEALLDDDKAKTAKDHANALKTWWLLFRRRGELLSHIAHLRRYIVCGRVTKRPIFEFVAPEIRPNDSLTAFPMEDDYSFGILQSGIHWLWFIERCSTFKRDPRYTSNTVFDSFPWPQTAKLKAIEAVADAAVSLRQLRRDLMDKHNLSLRELYRSLEAPGASPLKNAQEKLDHAVRDAYGMGKSDDPLAFLLDLNQTVANKEDAGQAVVGPGLPPVVKDRKKLVTHDCIRVAKGAVVLEEA